MDLMYLGHLLSVNIVNSVLEGGRNVRSKR